MTDDEQREHAEAIKHALGMAEFGPPMEGEEGWCGMAEVHRPARDDDSRAARIRQARLALMKARGLLNKMEQSGQITEAEHDQACAPLQRAIDITGQILIDTDPEYAERSGLAAIESMMRLLNRGPNDA